MLRPFAHPVVCCLMLLSVVAQSLKLVKLLSQQLPKFLMFRGRQSVAQQCWIPLYSSPNIVGATRITHCLQIKSLRVISFPRCTAGTNIVGSCCVRLHVALMCQHACPSGTHKVRWRRRERKRPQKVNPRCFSIHRSYFMSFNLSKRRLIFLKLNSKRLYLGFKKELENLRPPQREIRRFHIVW